MVLRLYEIRGNNKPDEFSSATMSKKFSSDAQYLKNNPFSFSSKFKFSTNFFLKAIKILL